MPFFGAFGGAWDEAMVARWSANPLGMLCPELGARMAANVAVTQDPAGNLKPAKDKSTERIDGIVAAIMAIGRAMVVQDEPSPSTACSLCEWRTMPPRPGYEGARLPNAVITA